jgi:hypothetical protein
MQAHTVDVRKAPHRRMIAFGYRFPVSDPKRGRQSGGSRCGKRTNITRESTKSVCGAGHNLSLKWEKFKR